ncbi:26S proteasome non-ATPase regulatory subunit 1 [Eumeta japonica]|uniref:26S proteasome non-ATPase regulatory subunit 1 n=1 Tax=Eumeta variegata TaxID=151549 RepID=A0A4C1SI53_EUMVA|nr:26S proteasome non-ATPase regulatory subunit 1 [Eumeta japonica]
MPSVVSLLAESYNPHVRYGAAMALGIACAGTGLRDAIALFEPMARLDPVNFVRQGALIASAMILIQHTDQTCPKTTFFRSLYDEVICNKHEDVMAKFGAILAQGIIDAGGRNCTLSLQSRTGHTNLQAVVGSLVFTQYWYWFPLAHALSLAFIPTCVIGLNSDLKMPQMKFKSAARPSMYAYPAPLEEKKSEERESCYRLYFLSLHGKKRRETAEKKDDENMDVDEEIKDSAGVSSKKKKKSPNLKRNVIKKRNLRSKMMKRIKIKTSLHPIKKKRMRKKKQEKEPKFEILENPARVMRQQLKVLTVAENQTYIPLKDVTIGGIIVTYNTEKD